MTFLDQHLGCLFWSLEMNKNVKGHFTDALTTLKVNTLKPHLRVIKTI